MGGVGRRRESLGVVGREVGSRWEPWEEQGGAGGSYRETQGIAESRREPWGAMEGPGRSKNSLGGSGSRREKQDDSDNRRQSQGVAMEPQGTQKEQLGAPESPASASAEWSHATLKILRWLASPPALDLADVPALDPLNRPRDPHKGGSLRRSRGGTDPERFTSPSDRVWLCRLSGSAGSEGSIYLS